MTSSAVRSRLVIFHSVFFFFFSSRRRHTRSDRDWSSDVCSSDLSSGDVYVEDPSLVTDTIVEGTRTALEFAVETGAQRFLFTSSGAVYGRQPSELTHIPESYLDQVEVSNRSTYGEAKWKAEQLCAIYHNQ